MSDFGRSNSVCDEHDAVSDDSSPYGLDHTEVELVYDADEYRDAWGMLTNTEMHEGC